jgi:hypothetical protein
VTLRFRIADAIAFLVLISIAVLIEAFLLLPSVGSPSAAALHHSLARVSGGSTADLDIYG